MENDGEWQSAGGVSVANKITGLSVFWGSLGKLLFVPHMYFWLGMGGVSPAPEGLSEWQFFPVVGSHLVNAVFSLYLCWGWG